MVEITLIEPNGTEHRLDVPAGTTILDAALARRVPGILGDCGGSCACSSCHIIVAAEWAAALHPVDELEDGMLDFAPEREEHSRLACRIRSSEKIDGLVARIPTSQY